MIDGFSADGLRGLGDGGWFEYNVVKNALVGAPADGNHDDGFQSWSVGPGGVGTGEVRDVVLRGNVFLNNENPDHPLHATLQGIGCFDGLFVDWVVENNVVVTDHWHGISLYGAIGGRVVNNTVLDLNGVSPGPPWIMLNSSDGTPSQNVLVRNNLATDYSLAGTGIVADHNVEIADAAALFVAPPFDLHLKAGSPAIDAGSATEAPPLDADRVPRPQGDGFDLGAFERCPGCLFRDDFERGRRARLERLRALTSRGLGGSRESEASAGGWLQALVAQRRGDLPLPLRQVLGVPALGPGREVGVSGGTESGEVVGDGRDGGVVRARGAGDLDRAGAQAGRDAGVADEVALRLPVDDHPEGAAAVLAMGREDRAGARLAVRGKVRVRLPAGCPELLAERREEREGPVKGRGDRHGTGAANVDSLRRRQARPRGERQPS